MNYDVIIFHRNIIYGHIIQYLIDFFHKMVNHYSIISLVWFNRMKRELHGHASNN